MNDLVRNCLQTTSLKGVPRIINSKTKGLKILWSVAVIILVSFSIYQTFLLVENYLMYPSTTVVGIETNSMYLGKIPFNLQVCNLNIYAFRSKIAQQSIHDFLKDYENHVEKNSICSDCTDEERSVVNNWASAYSSPNMLFQYMGSDLATQNIQNVEDFLIECRLVMLSGHYKYVPCTNRTRISVTPHPEYLSCLTIQLPTSDIDNYYIGTMLTFYLDTWPGDIQTPYIADSFFAGNSRGLFYQVYEPGTAPMDFMNFRELAPGFVSNVMIKYSWMQRLSGSYGQCKDDNRNYTIYGKQEVKQTLRICYDSCQVYRVQKFCNCTNLNQFIPENATFPFCNSPRHSARKWLAYNKCESQIQRSSLRKCRDCEVACSEMIMESAVSQSKWLMPSQFHSFYDDVLKDKPYAHRFDKYLQLFNVSHNHNCSLNENITSTCSDITSDLNHEEKLVHQNFAKIKVMLGSTSQLNYEQKPATSLVNLFGQLGGVLNLWSGISVVLVVEIIDFLVRVCQSNKGVKPV